MSAYILSSWRNRADDVMWDLVFYLSAVFTYILLFWFYQPKGSNGDDNTRSDEAGGTQRKPSAGSEAIDRERLGSIDSYGSRKSLKLRAQRKLRSMTRRKELVQRDIIVSLGLSPDEHGFEAFCDKFNSIEYVSNALIQAGFLPCDIIIGIDFTASNEWQGKRSFSRNCLHKTNGNKIVNPYQKVLHIIGHTLSFISKDKLVHAYGFGDSRTKDTDVFSLLPDGQHHDFHNVMHSYTKTAKSLKLSGPTNFAPIINKATELCKKSRQYHILILIVDGQVSRTCEQETIDAIVEASNHPLSIIVIGLGDGPFGTMFEYDDGLPKRRFDNLQFVNFHRTVTKSKHEAAFALHALMEIPDQYKAVQQLGYLDPTSELSRSRKEQ